MILRRTRTTAFFVVLGVVIWLAASAGAPAQNGITRVSVSSSGAQSVADSSWPAISGNGRHVAFYSLDGTLVPNDHNGVEDVFVHDLQTGATVRVSVDSNGVEGDQGSNIPSLSYDGRFVAFASWADNLVPDDTNQAQDIFLRDRDPDGNGVFDEDDGTTIRVSVDSAGGQADGGPEHLGSQSPEISADATHVAFMSDALNLVPNDVNRATDIFVRDLVAGTTVCASVDSAGGAANDVSFFCHLSGDGRFVAFDSFATNLVANDTNDSYDGFVRDLLAGVTECVSVDPAGVPGDRGGGVQAITQDGSLVGFESFSTNLVAGDTNGHTDLFLRDRAAGTTERINLTMSGAQADDDSWDVTLSADGRFVAFMSVATNLVTGAGANGIDADVFVSDRVTGHLTVASVGVTGAIANDVSSQPSLAADGTMLVFLSRASDLVAGDTNRRSDVFVHDRRSLVGAGWSNYGSGLPGTAGEPTLTERFDPVLGATLPLDVGNSQGATSAFGVLLVGTAPAAVPFHGGTLLVGGIAATIPLLFTGAALTLDCELPIDPLLAGFTLYAQVVEVDAGAADGLSFTPGLAATFGY